MPGRLTQLTRPDGVPTLLARLGVVVLMASAATVGWAAGPDRDEPDTPSRAVVSIDRLSGELPIARGEARPKLRSAAALPRLRGAFGRATATAPEPAATPSVTPAPSAPEPTATPEVTVVPVATPAPAAPAPTAAPPRPAPTPGPTFDSSG